MPTQLKSPGKQTAYMKLIQRFPLRPLRSKKDLDAATEVMDSLVDQGQLDRGEQDYLDVLCDLVEAYEAEHCLIEPLSDAEMLRFLLENKGVTQAVVARETKIAESTISEVLAGKRELSRGHIAKLARYFHVEPSVFQFEA